MAGVGRTSTHWNPGMLKWAREMAGISQEDAAVKLGTSVDKLLSWEAGDLAPTIPKLERMSELYKRPMAAFYLSSIPDGGKYYKDFRKPGGSEIEDYSLKFELLVRRSELQKNWAKKVYLKLKDPDPILKCDIVPTWDFEETADAIRCSLGITDEVQFAWKDSRKALAAWRNAVEQFGVLVIHNDPISEQVPVSIFRGFVNYGEPFSVIALNGSDAVNGRVFSLMHEFIHILVSKNGSIDERGRVVRQLSPENLEILCNGLASNVLVPAGSLLKNQIVLGCGINGWSMDGLDRLSKTYRVSSEVILNRLNHLDVISDDFYEHAKRKLKIQYEESLIRSKEEKGGAPPYPIMVLRKNGRRFSKLLFRAKDQYAISLSELSDCLGIKINHLESVRQELRKGGAV